MAELKHRCFKDTVSICPNPRNKDEIYIATKAGVVYCFNILTRFITSCEDNPRKNDVVTTIYANETDRKFLVLIRELG